MAHLRSRCDRVAEDNFAAAKLEALARLVVAESRQFVAIQFAVDVSVAEDEWANASRRMNSCAVYLSQLRAMLVRNLLLKKREKRKTMAVCRSQTSTYPARVSGFVIRSCSAIKRSPVVVIIGEARDFFGTSFGKFRMEIVHSRSRKSHSRNNFREPEDDVKNRHLLRGSRR